MNNIRHIGVLFLELMSTTVWAQSVSGTVTDDNNQPLPGATVLVQGSNVIEDLCLASGTYTFEMYDKYQDGGGPFSLTVDGTVVYSNDGTYSFTVSATFKIT